MTVLAKTLGKELSDYSIELYEFGTITKARSNSKNAFVEITVNSRLERVELYYNKDFGDIEHCYDMNYYDYINYLSVHRDLLIEKVEEVIENGKCGREIK